MYEVSCASCSSIFEYNVDDYIHLCPFCSSGFILDYEDGGKDIIGDHFIVPNEIDKDGAENIFFDWLEQCYHSPKKLKKDVQILGIYGMSLPFWVISLEAHTQWSGYAKRESLQPGGPVPFHEVFVEIKNRFNRKYRWAILARKSTKEHWGLDRIHHPKEPVKVVWDGFPLDESLGISKKQPSTTIYGLKVPFHFDQSNGLSVGSIQIKESVALARAKEHVQEYHRSISRHQVHNLVHCQTEMEVMGIQIIHLPFWEVRYRYNPSGLMGYFSANKEKRVLIQGHTQAVIEGEIPVNTLEKISIHFLTSVSLSFLTLFLSVFIHPLFLFAFLIFLVISSLTAWKIWGRHNDEIVTSQV